MTSAEMLANLKLMTGVDDADATLTLYINLAAQYVIKKAYPYRTDVTEVPERYQMKQLEIANYLVLKRGAEGQTSHNENGINRGYESGGVPESLLKDIVPMGKVVGGENEIPEEESTDILLQVVPG